MEKHRAQHRAAEAARCRQKSIEGTHKGVTALAESRCCHHRRCESTEGRREAGKPTVLKTTPARLTRFAPLSSFKSVASERRSSAACYFSACLAPKTACRRAPFNHLPRNLPLSFRLSAEGLCHPEPSHVPCCHQTPLLAFSLASSPAAPEAPAIVGCSCHREQNAPEQRKQFSRRYRGYVIECFVPAQALSPCTARRARKGCANAGERLELREHSQARQTCFLKMASKTRSVLAD